MAPSPKIRRTGVALFGVAAGMLTVGCAGSAAGEKAGGPPAPIELRLGTPDHEDSPEVDQAKEFIREVTRLSDGSIRITPDWHPESDGPEWDQRVARMVVSGEFDLGVIPSRSWDTEGVTTLRALNTPFLVTTNERFDKILTGDLADDLMAGLDEIGVVGLAMFPDGLRHVYSFDHPLASLADFAGTTIRVPRSATTTAVFEAFGARPTDDSGPNDPLGMESGYEYHPPATYVTGNVTPYPKANTLVANAHAFDALTDDQQEILRRAAANARDWAVSRESTDAQSAAEWCTGGQAVALATDADLDALVAATTPVVDALREDPTTAALIDRISEVPAGEPVTPEACDPLAESTAGTETSAEELNGIYRFEITDEEVAAEGLPPDYAQENVGTYTITIDGDQWCYDQDSDTTKLRSHYCDRVAIDDGTLVFYGDNNAAPLRSLFRWSVTDDGDLAMTVDPSVPAEFRPYMELWVLEPWVRIGDVGTGAGG